MAPNAKSAARKTPKKAKPPKPLRVLVEMVMSRDETPAAAFRATGDLELTGFQLDSGFDPIPVGAAPDQAMALEAAREATVLVRGTADKAQIADLKKQKNVAAVWLDTRIAPFDSLPALTSVPDIGVEEKIFVDTVESAAFGACPIPPCDCAPKTPKGTIADVANYLGVDQIWTTGRKGQGIVVGVVDGGVSTPSRIAGGRIPQVIGGPKTDWGEKAFWDGHGEMSATDVLGMAPEAQLYDIRLVDSPMDALGALISDAIAGFQWAINQHQVDGTPQVLTNSWGIYQKSWDPVYATDPNHPFTRKVVDAINEGILVLFAAGNCGGTCPDGRCGTDNGPGKSIWGANGHPLVMTVGAANIKEQLIGYSSEGPAALDQQKPDFCAPSHFTGYFNSDNGTSAACPVAAGVVALLKQCKTDLTPSAAKTALKATAKNIGPSGWDQHSGSGIIQAKAAFDRICPQVRPCEREREKAARYREFYQRSRDRRYLCLFYYWTALYFRCWYLKNRDRRYLCRFYYYAARYCACQYRLLGDRRYYHYYRHFADLYRRTGCR